MKITLEEIKKDTNWDREEKRKTPAWNIQNIFQIFLFLSSGMKLSVEVNEEEQNMSPQKFISLCENLRNNG